ncbi:hypothetical protein B0H14DRAFT_2647405 [Mycena olivaceomarginata]|nr:hypothetical protein B0H14DRAFT_2647405 [Mycena olivaceomarginata]
MSETVQSYLRFNSVRNSHSSNTTRTLLVTARHVVFTPDKNENTQFERKNSSQRRYDVPLFGDAVFNKYLKYIETEIGSKALISQHQEGRSLLLSVRLLGLAVRQAGPSCQFLPQSICASFADKLTKHGLRGAISGYSTTAISYAGYRVMRSNAFGLVAGAGPDDWGLPPQTPTAGAEPRARRWAHCLGLTLAAGPTA